MVTNNLNMRLDARLKAEASQVFASYGLSTNQAIRLFLNQVVSTGKVPLSFDFHGVEHFKPKLELLQAMEELENEDLPEYSSIEEMLGALDEKV